MTEQSKRKSEEDVTEKSLFLFFPASDQLKMVLKSYKVLNKLIIIGQNLESLEGIEELRNLEELWVVECNLQQKHVEPVSQCWGLKRLYLYNNELTAIPNLDSLSKLTHLWLSDNQLDSFQGVNSLLNVRELCLSNNNIATVDIKLKSTLKIVFMNLAGNPIKSMKEIHKLESLRRLRWLVLSDPLFRTSPIALLANLRQLVIHCLPTLEKLDMLHISASERTQTAKFFDGKLEYYRLSLQNTLAKLYNLQKTGINLEIKELEMIWNALRRHGHLLEKDESRQSNNLRFWEDEGHRWRERLKLLQLKFDKLAEVTTETVNLEVESCGNLQFLEVDLTDVSSRDGLKNKISSFICSHLKGNVLDINLQNAWSIQGHYQAAVLQSQFEDSSDHVYVVTPVGDLDIQPLKFVEDILFGNGPDRELLVTHCLARADPLVSDGVSLHRQLLLRSQTLLSPRLMVVCGIGDPSQLTVQEPSFHGCDQWKLREPSSLVPLYILHYQYVFQDYFKPLKMLPEEPDTKQDSLPTPIPLDSKLFSQNVTVLQLTASNLQKLDIPLMEHVTMLDLSYNQFEDVSSVGSLFPKLAILNMAFNRIHTLFNLQGLHNITHFTLSWNFLSDFLSSLRSLKGLGSLKHVDLSSNPFRDVTCDLHQQFFVCKYLKNLMTFNDFPLLRSLLKGEVTLQGQEQFPLVPAWRRHKTPLSLCWKAELADTESENHIGQTNNQVISITMKGLKLTQFHSVFSLSKLKWLDLSHNLFYGSSVLKASAALEEVNLSHNVIEGFSCSSDRFKHLSKLNISHNYIGSLAGFGTQAFPQLKFLDLSNNQLQSLAGLSGLKTLTELYVSHNHLQDSNTLTNCKDMKELIVLDVSFNPLAQNDSFRSICLYTVTSLKYINGCKVRLSEAKSAVTLHEGLLDQDYLIRAHKSASINSLTQLSLPNCCIKKIDPSLVLPNVTSLTLDHNKISTLSWVQSFPNLNRLSLSHNRVSKFGDDCSLPPYPSTAPHSLKSLILNGNHIKTLPPLKLHMFPDLQLLVLNNNEISSLSGLKNNCQLEHLVLDKNKLSAISCDQTGQLFNLRELYLERNSLTRLDFVRPLRKLLKLFIGHNKLVARCCLEPLADLPNLEELTIHGNPIFRSSKSYRDCLPRLCSLQLLEGQPVNKTN